MGVSSSFLARGSWVNFALTEYQVKPGNEPPLMFMQLWMRDAGDVLCAWRRDGFYCEDKSWWRIRGEVVFLPQRQAALLYRSPHLRAKLIPGSSGGWTQFRLDQLLQWNGWTCNHGMNLPTKAVTLYDGRSAMPSAGCCKRCSFSPEETSPKELPHYWLRGGFAWRKWIGVG